MEKPGDVLKKWRKKLRDELGIDQSDIPVHEPRVEDEQIREVKKKKKT